MHKRLPFAAGGSPLPRGAVHWLKGCCLRQGCDRGDDCRFAHVRSRAAATRHRAAPADGGSGEPDARALRVGARTRNSGWDQAPP